MASGDTKTESYLRAAAEGTRADLPTDTCCNTKTQNLILGVANRIMDVEDEVEELKNNPDVVDIVDTYQDLQAYNTSTLTDKDIIRVLEDSTHNNSSTYYRWNATTSQFDYIGEAGGSDGAQMEIVNLTITGVTQDGVAVLASKYNYEVVDLANANKNVVFKITIPSGSGLPAVGTYQLPLFNYSNDVVGSMSTVNVGGTLYSINFFYDNYDDDVNTGVLTLTEIQTGGGEGFHVLTEDDLNWYDQQTGDQYVALWLLPTGHYTTDENSPNVAVYSYEQDGDFVPGDTVSVEMSPLIIINNYDPGNTYPDIMIIYPDDIAHYIIDGSTGLVDSFQNYGSTFTGTDGYTDGVPGLVPAPATTDAGKFLKADGTWDTAGGDTVYSNKTTSNSNTGGAVYIGNLNSSQTEQADPTSTDNHYKYFWALPYNNINVPGSDSIAILGNATGTYSIALGTVSSSQGSNAVSIGPNSRSATDYSMSVGNSATVNSGTRSMAIGNGTIVNANNSVALGTNANATRDGEVNVGAGTSGRGYSSTNYRVIGGVHDGVDAHDAATVAQGNTLSTSAPDTSTVGVLGQLWTDTTNMHTYQCTAISGNTYTWTQRW